MEVEEGQSLVGSASECRIAVLRYSNSRPGGKGEDFTPGVGLSIKPQRIEKILIKKSLSRLLLRLCFLVCVCVCVCVFVFVCVCVLVCAYVRE